MIKRILIPKARIAILIGKDGAIKKGLESLKKTKIEIADEIAISGEALDVMDTCNVIKAIGRGFDPQDAMELLDEKNDLCIIPLPNDRKILKRVRSRIIGTRGKCRKTIERLTNTKLSIYGKTVSIIGEYDAVDIARDGVEKLIEGSPHSNVYKFIEERTKK